MPGTIVSEILYLLPVAEIIVTALHQIRLWRLNDLQQPIDNILGIDAIGFGSKIGQNAVAHTLGATA